MLKKDTAVKTIEANRNILGTLLACSFKLQKIIDFEKGLFPTPTGTIITCKS